MIPQYSDIQYFLEICEVKNLSRASERLGVVQPTLSQSMKRLEEAVGQRLLVRLKTGVELTKAGLAFRQKALGFIRQWSDILLDVKRKQEGLSGVFRLGCHPSVAMYTLDRFLPHLLKDHSEIEIRLSHGLSREILEKVVSFEIDFGLVVNPKRHPELVLKRLCLDRVSFWKSKEIEIPTTLIYDPHLHQSQVLLQKIKSKKTFLKFLESSNLEVIGHLTRKGCGVGILPERVAKMYDLVHFHRDFPSFADELYLVYRADYQKSYAAKYIVDLILSSKI